MTTLLRVYAGHDRQIYRSPEVDEISIGLILDFQCFLFHLFLILLTIIAVVLIFLVPTSFS
jgi:hypothetical protein